MRKVVDTGYMRRSELRDFLTANKSNLVVINEHATIEIFKADTLTALSKAMEILSEFPKQVIVLKNTKTVCGLSGRQAGLQRRMIDSIETKAFPAFCRRLNFAKVGCPITRKELEARGRIADSIISRIQGDATKFPIFVKSICQSFSLDEVSKLKRYATLGSSAFTEKILAKLINNIIRQAERLFNNYPKPLKRPKLNEIPNLYTFRYVLMTQTLALKWIAKGGIECRRLDNLTNDLIVMHHATYATYFDGVLSKDHRVNEAFDEGSALLNVIKHGISRIQPNQITEF